ncbi:hypothetical protein BX666DRAFT_1865495 [Dichotomocladium elegans]|nr:hypothetical protein BX666DRAFT_1865495 [Dichotomocladium elegans]
MPIGSTQKDAYSHAEEHNSVSATAELDEECKVCRRNERLALVRRDLAEDLAYIDETYYSASTILLRVKSRQGEDETVENDGQWAKLTMKDVVAGTRKTGRRLSHASSSSTLVVNLSGRSLIKMSPSIGYLDNITTLNLSHNQMATLPETIGYIKDLEILDVSHNQLRCLPDTIAYLTKLTELNIGFNRLKSVPTTIGALSKLKTVALNDNQLASLPVELANLSGLVSLNVSNNPLRALPVEITYLSSLRKLIAEGCDFVPEFRYPLEHNPPSLVEICSRIAVRKEMQIPCDLPDHIKAFLARANRCSFCGGPFFEAYVKRGRFIERSNDLTIALEYRLCSSHWTDDTDRTVALFASLPETAPLPRSTVDNPIDMSGLDQIYAPRPSQRPTLERYHDHSHHHSGRARSESPKNHPYTLPKSQQSPSNFFIPSRFGSPETVSIRSLRSYPNLPTLPDIEALEHERQRSSAPPLGSNRTRSSSMSSVTRRLAAMLSPAPSTQPLAGSGLRQQQYWNSNEVVDFEAADEQGAASASENHESTVNTRSSKMAGPRLIRSGLSGLGAHFASRDRSETL